MQCIDFIIEQIHAHGQFGVLGREDVDRVAAHAECAALEIAVVARVLHRDQPSDDLALTDFVTGAQGQNHLVILGRIADTVDGRDRRDDHYVAPLHQAFRGRQAHLLDMFVDRGIFFDKQVTLRNVCLRLVIIVVRNEVFDRVVREKLAKFGIELRRQGFVRGENDRRTA